MTPRTGPSHSSAKHSPYNDATVIQFHSLEIPQLERFLERQKSGLSLQRDIVDLDLVLRQILQQPNELVFIATFGDASRDLIGQRLSAQYGIVGQVYQNGTPYVSADVQADDNFYPQIDETLGHKTHSVVCVPIYIGKHVCGVLELINKRDGGTFTERDKTLLEIFAGYTSFMLQNALDAKRAHELAKRDDLTGLYNDRWFHVRLSELIGDVRASGRVAVLIFMDLDQFKVINDCHGHLAGSQVLREVGFILKRIVRTPDATVARYGGDEFVMILPGTALDEGVAICEEIRRTIAATTFLDRDWGFSMPALNLGGIVTASLGIAEYRGDPAAPRAVAEGKNAPLRRHDAAMYRAKSAGKNQVVVSRAGSELFEPRRAIS